MREPCSERSTAFIKPANGLNTPSVDRIHLGAHACFKIRPPLGGLCVSEVRKSDFGGSSNGRTEDSDSFNLGSNPSPPAINENGPIWGRFHLWTDQDENPKGSTRIAGSDPEQRSDATLAA